MENIILKAEKFQHENKFSKALILYEKILSLDESNLIALVGVADCLYNLQRFEQAKEKCFNALSINSNLSKPYIILAYLENDSQAMLENASKALKLAPDSAEALCCYGIVLGIQGELQNSISYFNKAVEIDPEFYLAHYNLSVCYQKVNDTKNNYNQSKIRFTLKPTITNLRYLAACYLAQYRYLHLCSLLLPFLYLAFNVKILFLPHVLLGVLHSWAILDSIQLKDWTSFKGNVRMTIFIIVIDVLIILKTSLGLGL